MPPYRIAVRNETRGHPHYAWFAMGRTYDSPEEARDELMKAEDAYPATDGYTHRVEDLIRKDDETASWRALKGEEDEEE